MLNFFKKYILSKIEIIVKEEVDKSFALYKSSQKSKEAKMELASFEIIDIKTKVDNMQFQISEIVDLFLKPDNKMPEKEDTNGFVNEEVAKNFLEKNNITVENGMFILSEDRMSKFIEGGMEAFDVSAELDEDEEMNELIKLVENGDGRDENSELFKEKKEKFLNIEYFGEKIIETRINNSEKPSWLKKGN